MFWFSCGSMEMGRESVKATSAIFVQAHRRCIYKVCYWINVKNGNVRRNVNSEIRGDKWFYHTSILAKWVNVSSRGKDAILPISQRNDFLRISFANTINRKYDAPAKLSLITIALIKLQGLGRATSFYHGLWLRTRRLHDNEWSISKYRLFCLSLFIAHLHKYTYIHAHTHGQIKRFRIKHTLHVILPTFPRITAISLRIRTTESISARRLISFSRAAFEALVCAVASNLYYLK